MGSEFKQITRNPDSPNPKLRVFTSLEVATEWIRNNKHPEPIVPRKVSPERSAQIQKTLRRAVSGRLRSIRNLSPTLDQIADQLELIPPLPVVVTMNDESKTYGFRRHNTNLIGIRDIELNFRGENLEYIIAHETGHLFLDVSSGARFKLGTVESGLIKWLNEVFAEYPARLGVCQSDPKPTLRAYTFETVFGDFLYEAVGKQLFFESFLTGDFTKLAQALDAICGNGITLNALTAQSAKEALKIILPKYRRAGFRHKLYKRIHIPEELRLIREELGYLLKPKASGIEEDSSFVSFRFNQLAGSKLNNTIV